MLSTGSGARVYATGPCLRYGPVSSGALVYGPVSPEARKRPPSTGRPRPTAPLCLSHRLAWPEVEEINELCNDDDVVYYVAMMM